MQPTTDLLDCNIFFGVKCKISLRTFHSFVDCVYYFGIIFVNLFTTFCHATAITFLKNFTPVFNGVLLRCILLFAQTFITISCCYSAAFMHLILAIISLTFAIINNKQKTQLIVRKKNELTNQRMPLHSF